MTNGPGHTVVTAQSKAGKFSVQCLSVMLQHTVVSEQVAADMAFGTHCTWTEVFNNDFTPKNSMS